MSEEDVQTSLLAEVEGTFGEGAASSRVKQLEAILRPIYAALPKNEKGYLGHATVRYALHRLFVQRHGWFIKGLDAAGGHRNATTSAGLLKEQVPAYIQDLFEQRLGGRGFGLHELGVLAATIEHLVHSEAIKRLGNAFKVHNLLPTSLLNKHEADDANTYSLLTHEEFHVRLNGIVKGITVGDQLAKAIFDRTGSILETARKREANALRMSMRAEELINTTNSWTEIQRERNQHMRPPEQVNNNETNGHLEELRKLDKEASSLHGIGESSLDGFGEKRPSKAMSRPRSFYL